MRVKVVLNIDKPLQRGVKVPGSHAPKWIGFKYERLGDFCYFRGRIGHTERDCTFKGMAKDGESETNWFINMARSWLSLLISTFRDQLGFVRKER